MTKQDQARMLHQMATNNAVEWFDKAIKNLEDGVRTLKARRDDFKSAAAGDQQASSFSTPVNILSWSVNDINNITMNFRLDMTVNHGSALATAANAVAAAAK